MISEIDKLKHFHIEDYSGTNFTDDFNNRFRLLKIQKLLYLIKVDLLVL